MSPKMTLTADLNESMTRLAAEVLLSTKQENIVLSPLSIYSCLALISEGAKGDTRLRFSSILGIDADQSGAAAVQWLLRRLGEGVQLQLGVPENVPAKRGAKEPVSDDDLFYGTSEESDRAIILNSAFGTWVQEGYEIEPDFRETVEVACRGIVDAVDFTNGSAVADRLNDWIDQQTNGKIKSVFDGSEFDPLTRLAVGSAVYFKAAWADWFEPAETGTFHLEDGTTVEAPMLTRQILFASCSITDEYAAISVPYQSGFSMSFVMPLRAGLPEFISGYYGADREPAMQSAVRARVNLTIPEFNTRTSLELKDPLTHLGAGIIFDPQSADLSGISLSEQLYLSKVTHDAAISVDRYGTEAAAVTFGTIMTLGITPEEEIDLVFDRPFLFTIESHSSGTPLFMDRIDNPT